ncbi:MAG TPA: hypothetical protein VGR16_05860 [Thermomicrobiales bacterium]|nr:hypothetical protein [Thermomicrobiales bacterium]
MLLGDNQEAVELINVCREHMVDALDLGLKVSVVIQPEENDPGIRSALAKDELAEIAIVGDEDAVLAGGNSEHVGVPHAVWMVAANSRCVVAQAMKIWNQPGVGALIE